MEDQDGDPELIEAVVENLRAWRGSTPFPTETPISDSLQEAMRHQDRIGWKSFMEGFISHKWVQCQREHYELVGSQKSAQLYMVRVQRRIREIAWKLWEQRNEELHHGGTTIHSKEQGELQEHIVQEWGKGVAKSVRKCIRGKI